MLYTCYELVKPDVALEVAWRCDLHEYVMPYFIQFVKDLSLRVDTVQKKTDDIKKKEDKKVEEAANIPIIDSLDPTGFLFPNMIGNGLQALMPPPGSMPNMGMGMGMGMNFNTGYGTNSQW